MWAEANQYYYRGSLVAKLKGGNIFNAPEIVLPLDEEGNPIMPEPNGQALHPVDIEAMIEANKEMLTLIEQTTVKKIIAIYKKHRRKLDCFHVAFSGGKDSQVLLDLVKKALPKGSFVVVFGDTGMEFPDTYNVVEKTEKQCSEEKIPFYIAKSQLEPKDSWEMFGPPSRVLRWCCYVHKSAPQTFKLREVTGKNEYSGLAFVGVRAHESSTRSEYDYFNAGKKIKGQYSHNSILEWTSAEIWLYIFANEIVINEAYKKGSARVGCLCCPMGGGKSGYIEHKNYPDDTKSYFDFIRKSNGRKSMNVDEYLTSGGWSARKNGRDLADNPNHCAERLENGQLFIEIFNPISDWNEWIKTINIPTSGYSIRETTGGYTAILHEDAINVSPLNSKLFRQVFHKAACCKGCKVCEANCPNGAIRFNNSRVEITGCVQCLKCHEIDSGCLIYHSIRHPQGGGTKMKSLNTMSNHAPKKEWFVSFFEKKSDFFLDHGLGSEQISFFTRFLKDAGVAEKKQITSFGELISKLGWDSDSSLGLALINLVSENPQVAWYVSNLDIGTVYSRKDVEEMLLASDVKPAVAKSVCGAFKRITETPFGTRLQWGYVSDDWEMARTKCLVTDPCVVLYGLFKFAEKCNDHKGFTLATLLNDSIDRDGISPTRIFGLDRDDMTPILLGLTARYPDFINAAFTHDMDKITLAEDKTSQDVLDLFKGGIPNA